MKLRLRPHHAPRFQPVVRADDPHVTTLPVPGFRQARDYTCGFATALMAIRYFGASMPASDLFRNLGTDRGGTRQSAMVRELRAAGLRANVRYDVDFTRICQEIDRNKLVIGYLADHEHWLLIYGYGREPARVFVADPRPDEPCEHAWDGYGDRLGGFGIICSHPRDSIPLRQPALKLAEVSPPAQGPELPPPPPLRQLRCEVRYLRTVEPYEPAQLALPFAS